MSGELQQVRVKARTCVPTRHVGELTLLLVCVQGLQGAHRLTALACIHTPDLQAAQVVPHVPDVHHTHFNKQPMFTTHTLTNSRCSPHTH